MACQVSLETKDIKETGVSRALWVLLESPERRALRGHMGQEDNRAMLVPEV